MTTERGESAGTGRAGVATARGQQSLWRRLFFVAVMLLFVLLAVEIVLQLFYFATVGQWLFTRTGLPLFVADERFVYWNKPHMSFTHRTNEFQSDIRTNGQGFRIADGGQDYPLAKAADTERILLLGPSFAFGWGVNYEETLAAHLQQMLNQDRPAGQRPVEIINAGVPSMGPALNLDWYRSVGKEFAPDLVIQLIYTTMAVPRVGNRHDIDVDEQGYLVRRNVPLRSRLTVYAKKSAIVFYTWMAYVRARGAVAAPAEGGTILGAGREAKLHGTFQPDDPEAVEALAYYDDLRAAVESSGARLLVVFVPLSYCVHPEDVARWSHLGVRDVAGQIVYDAAFCEYLQSLGFDVVNTTADLQAAAAAGTRLYYLVDIHWTPAGNEEAARAVARHMRHEGPHAEQ